jgi:hypothetical protein
MLEVLIEILGEFILQFFGELLLEIGLHALAEPFRREPNIWLASLGYTFFGCAIGGLSILVFPTHFTPAGFLRIVNLFATPLVVGACMAALGAWRKKRSDSVFLVDRFLYGFIFAAGTACVRFKFAA